ncbi:hypothetical protein HYV58_01115 [Candidatus Peregrinibacteria bacterium]|nr:hypothetical protein [Candidatus Peregrinibacteria bacterium]
MCNSLALGNATEKSDIDLFIITEAKRLASARFCLKILTQLFGMRVHHKKVAGRFCLSFFVTEDNLNLKELAFPFDPHFASFAATMVPFVGPLSVEKFFRDNEAWILPYFGNFHSPQFPRNFCSPALRACQVFIEKILGLFGPNLGKRLFQWQLRRDRDLEKNSSPKTGGIVMEPDIFKFHINDTRQEVSRRFLDTYRRVSVSGNSHKTQFRSQKFEFAVGSEFCGSSSIQNSI